MPPKTEQAAPAADNPHADADLLAKLETETVAPGQVLPDQAPPPEPAIKTEVLVSMVLAPAFALLAPNWNVQQAEITQLASAYAVVIDKYFPDGMGQYVPEIMAGMLTLAIIAPRINIPRKKPEEQKEPQHAAPSPESAPDASPE